MNNDNNRQDTSITRVEVIGLNGREFTKRLNGTFYTISIQDEGRTIKLFETNNQKEQNEK